MKLVGKKKAAPQAHTDSYDVYGGITVTKNDAGYEIKWRSPNLTSIIVPSEPLIDSDVEIEENGNQIKVTLTECKLKLTTKEGTIKARITTM
jgi:hypothetical protein